MASSSYLSNFATDLANFDKLSNDGFSTPSINTPASVQPSVPVTNAGMLGGVTGAVTGAVANAIFSSRVVAILLGLIALAGSIFLFKGQSIIEVGKSAVRVAGET